MTVGSVPGGDVPRQTTWFFQRRHKIAPAGKDRQLPDIAQRLVRRSLATYVRTWNRWSPNSSRQPGAGLKSCKGRKSSERYGSTESCKRRHSRADRRSKDRSRQEKAWAHLRGLQSTGKIAEDGRIKTLCDEHTSSGTTEPSRSDSQGFRLATRSKRLGILGSDRLNRFDDRTDSIHLFGKNGPNASSVSEF
jgi:hypothetical protein